MAADANIRAVITAEDRASGVINGFGSSLGGLGKLGLVAGTAIAAAGAAVTAFGVESVKAFSESEDTLAQLNAVLKSTGGIAGVTAQQATELATSLQKTTKFSDEAVLSAENMLLTFTNISKDVFPDTTKAVADMAQAMGTDLKSTAIQVGKALQDPVNGVTALQRVGVRLSDSQKTLIENLVKSGKTMEAQKVILKELQTEFGGSAEAAGNTFSGSIEKAKNAMNDLMETIGGAIAQAISPFIARMQEFISTHGPQIQATVLAIVSAFGQLVSVVSQIVTAVWPALSAVIQASIPIVKASFDAWVAFGNYWANILGPVIQTVATFFVQWILPALQTVWQEIQTQLLPALRDLWTQIGPILTPVLKFLAEVLGGVLIVGLLAAVGALRLLVLIIAGVAQGIANFIATVKDMAGQVVNGFNSMVNGIKNAVSGVYEAIVSPFRNAFNWVRDNAGRIGDSVKSIGGGFKFDLPKFASGVQNFGGGMAIVGERGPELVNLPRGADVIPNNQIGSMGGSTTVNISINSVYSAGTELEKRKFANDILNSLRDVANSKNMSLGDLIS